MANYDNATGLTPISTPALKAGSYVASAAITKGDLLALVAGKVLPYAPGTHDDAIGVAAHTAADTETVIVYNDPNTEFVVQVATGTSYVKATHDGGRYDLIGGTGAMELELATQTDGILQVVRHHPVPGSLEVGAHAKVDCRIAKHNAASLPNSVPGPITIGGMTLDSGRLTAGPAAGSGETVTPKFGVLATAPANGTGWGQGSVIVTHDDKKLKVNTGTAASVTWTVVGTQS
jgi:hypothetical protein